MQTMIKITKISMLYFWSCEGIKIFSLFFLFIDWSTLDPLFAQKFIKNCNGNTDCKSGYGDSVCFSSPVCLSVRLVGTCYGLSAMGLGLVLVVFRLVLYKISRSQGRSASNSRQAWMYITSCQGGETDPDSPLPFLWIFVPNP